MKLTNTIAQSYDDVYINDNVAFFKIPKRFPQHRNEALIKLASSGKRVLEIGCGDGNVLYNLSHNFAELYGIEISQIRADKADKKVKKNNLDNVKIFAGNIENGLDFADEFFDVILWADVIEHVVDLFAAMAEIKRLLAPQGKLITCTPNIAELRRRLTLLFGKFPSTSGKNEGLLVRPGELFDGGHLHYFTFSSLAKLYKKYEIQPINYLGFGNLGILHNLYPPLLSGSVCITGVKTN